MTLYRRFPDLEALLSALMTREFGRGRVRGARGGGRGTAHACASGPWRWSCRRRERLHADPLFDRLLDVDPELLLPYVTLRLGGMQRMASPGWRRSCAAADGSVRDGDPEVLGARGRADRARLRARRATRRSTRGPSSSRAVDGYLRP